MKHVLTLSFFILFACGGEPINEDMTASIGQTRDLKADEMLTAEEKTNFAAMCSALDAKVNFLKNIVVNTSKTLEFLKQEANCGQVSAQSTNVSSTVNLNNGSLSLSGTPFTDIVTSDSPRIKDFCTKTTSDSSQEIPRGYQYGSQAMWFAVYPGRHAKCNGPNGEDKELCLYMETGVKNGSSNASFLLKEVEVVKVSIDSEEDYYGMEMSRTFASSASCSGDGQLYKKAQTFVKINN